MRIRFWGIGIFLTLAVSACSTAAPFAPAVPTAEQTSRSLGIVTPPAPTLSPIAEKPSPIPRLTSSATDAPLPANPLSTCLPSTDYTWSYAYIPDSVYIAEILPTGDDTFILRGGVDGNDGTWLAKMDSDGELLWQNVYGSRSGGLKIAPNGNLVLEFERAYLELAPDGSVVRGVSVPRFHANADGGFTFFSSGQVARYKDLQTPLWQVAIKNLDAALGDPTSDGGALFAYAGNYNDYSVYWVPTYTDIKVIKISPEGEVIQRVYGKLVGYETLDFLQATNDGGALLAGSHVYEELGADLDIWLMKVNAGGGISWQSTLKLAPNPEFIRVIYPLKNSYLIPVDVDYEQQLVLVRLKANGSLAWQKAITSSRGQVVITAAADTPDGGLLLAGETREKNSIYWLARLDAKGSLVWEKTIGYAGIPGATDTQVDAILPLGNGEILIAGSTDLLGDSLTTTGSAWLARIQDSGQLLGLLTLTPGKFSLITTLGSRPNTLPDEIINTAEIPLKEISFSALATNLKPAPACLGAGASFPTPATLPTLTPSVSPIPSFARDLYLTNPPMQGDDVLKLQQRLSELDYSEVGIPDGIFGKMTEAAVRRFQERNGLKVDGYVGPKTWAALFHPKAVPAS